ncbi:nuclear factor related to kappa-B-binding protein [Drosophila persimilis]|nr:nuclear factor related to kappa-B-binding protein [Drosophila persimilis]
MSNNININSMLRPSLDSEEEEEDDIGQMSVGSSSSSGASSNRSSSSSSSSAPGSLPEDDVDVEDEDISDQDAITESETEDDTTTCQSDELELAQLSKRDTFRLPRGLCENSAIFHEFFSMETWQLLPQHVQARLQSLLPDFTGLVSAPQAGAEQQRTLVQLFNGGLQRFGQSPLLQLQRQLEDGNLRPDVLKLRRSIQHSSRREFRFQQAERLSQLAKELFLSREHMLKLAYTSSPPDESAAAAKSMMPRPRKRKPPALSMENKMCSQRAKKRYVQELLEVIQELKVPPGEISAEEEDEECADLMKRLPKMETEPKVEATAVRSSNAADKKSIYNTFFKRRPGVDDEQVLRSMQAGRIPQLNDKNFKKYLRDYKRRKVEQPENPEFDTSEVRLRDICTRAQFVGSFKPGRKPKALLARLNPDPPALVRIGVVKNEPEEDIFIKEETQQQQKHHLQQQQDHVPKEPMPKKMPPQIGAAATAAAPVPALIPKLEPISVPTPASTIISNLSTNSPTNPPLKAAAHIVGSPPARGGEVIRTAASPRPACYFSLLRDLFVSTPQHRLTYGELQILLATWREKHSDAVIPTGDVARIQQPDWSSLLQSAVNFLAADVGPLPAEYVPYIEHKTMLNIYQWIGAGRDSDARLCTLCQYWLKTQKEEQSVATTVHLNPSPGTMFIATVPTSMHVDASPTPPPRCPTTWTVRTASQADILEFQRQERLRFEYPHRPFTYRLNGYESVVGPVKGIYTQSLPLNKARGHAVMVDDRPPFVTILTLVRDATARLPNGEGTRSEISELLKCSQFVNHQAAENVLQTIVSGALDRMHGGIDPCVKYDAKRKIWIYLHRNRSEEEFERMHKLNMSLVKQKQQQKKNLAKPKKEDGESTMEMLDMPALVASAGNPTPAAGVSVSPAAAGPLLQVKKLPPLPVKCPPVPPLKYNIPPANNNNTSTTAQHSPTANTTPIPSPTMQKSLLKPVPMGAVHRPVAVGTPKAGNFSISKISPQRNTTPILVSTPSGMQTVHVATTPTSTQGSSTAAAVNKKLMIKKTPTTSKIGNFIIPLDQQQQQQQQQHSPQQQQHPQVLGKPKSMTISPRPQMPKNIIRLLPAGAAATGHTKPPQVQILGPRVVPQSTVRPVQQKIGAVSIISNKSVATSTETSTSPITIATSSSTAVSAVTGGGTIVKMSPQAFATLQQQQLKQKAMGGTAKIASPVQSTPQQRILVGNTAISSNKKIVFQALAKTSPKILTTTATIGGTVAVKGNLSSPQQRIVLQNFKQAAAGGAATVVSTSNATRVIRTTTPVSTAAGGASGSPTTQGGQIITLDSLLQKQQQQQQQSGGKLLTTGSNIIQLATSSSGNVITLTPNQSQATQPIQVQAKHLPTMARIVSATGGGGPTMVPKIIGKTTVLSGKPLLLHAKAIKQLGGGSVVTTQPTATTTTAGTNAVRTTQSIVIGGQTVKIQGAIPARPGGAPMQTVIMGNQLLRLAPTTSGSGSSSSSTSTTTNNHLTTVASSGIATAPKTLLIGAGGTQTLRLAKNVLLANKQGTSNSTGSSNATGGATAGNNLVFAVQGNGGQLFFSQGLQGMNLKPLSNMKVIPMVTAAGAAAAAGGKITVTTTAGGEAKKLMSATVLKTAASGNGN